MFKFKKCKLIFNVKDLRIFSDSFTCLIFCLLTKNANFKLEIELNLSKRQWIRLLKECKNRHLKLYEQTESNTYLVLPSF